uniref:DNA 3'-5' helicase n=1 Tax=Raja clavata polyomavirus 1 TaxID=3072331 RepID=A0AA51NH35_9POLY|nr:LT [Raja clavata polyomavirus 1]
MDYFSALDVLQKLLRIKRGATIKHAALKGMRDDWLKDNHPDKGGSTSKCQKMNAAWEAICKSEREDHRFSRAEDSDSEDEGPSGSQWTPPRRSINVPSYIRAHVEKPSEKCHRCYNLFVICCPSEKMEAIVHSMTTLGVDINCQLTRTVTDISFTFFSTMGTHRPAAIEKACRTNCTMAPFVVFIVHKTHRDPLIAAMRDPSRDGNIEDDSFPTASEEDGSVFDMFKFTNYALTSGITNLYLLMGSYDNLAKPCEHCVLCKEDKVHSETHRANQQNAQIFFRSKDKRKLASTARDTVLAQHTYNVCTMQREDLFNQYLTKALDCCRKVEITPKVAASVSIFIQIMHGDAAFIQFVNMFIECFVKAQPKRRVLMFRGPYNSGKTTIANAIRDLFQAPSLNMNCKFDDLKFELGRSIGKFMVLMEDVMGIPVTDDGTYGKGFGMCNLDKLRDHLDGLCPVGLEQKHVNKMDQVFPPCLITCNPYVIPKAVRQRILKAYAFNVKPYLCKAIKDYEVNLRFLSSKECLFFAMACTLPDDMWKEEHVDFVKIFRRDIKEYNCYYSIPQGEDSGQGTSASQEATQAFSGPPIPGQEEQERQTSDGED